MDKQSQQTEEILAALRIRQDLLDRQIQELQGEREFREGSGGWWPWGTKEKAD